MADRNATYAVAQYCIHRHPEEMTDEMRKVCLGERFASIHEPNGPWCGFHSAKAVRWLQEVRALSRHCADVLFTVVAGEGPPLKATSGQMSTEGCAYAIVDTGAQHDLNGSAQGTKHKGWTMLVVPETIARRQEPYFTKTMTFAGSRLFPAARTLMYASRYVRMKSPPHLVMSRIRKWTALPWTAMSHPNPTHNAAREMRALLGRLPRGSREARLILAQQALYEKEGAFNQIPGMIEAGAFVQQRVPRAPRRRSGWPPANPAMVVRWLDCAQMMEVATVNWRSHLNWNYVVDILGAREHVFFLLNREKEQVFLSVRKISQLAGPAEQPSLDVHSEHSGGNRPSLAGPVSMALWGGEEQPDTVRGAHGEDGTTGNAGQRSQAGDQTSAVSSPKRGSEGGRV